MEPTKCSWFSAADMRNSCSPYATFDTGYEIYTKDAGVSETAPPHDKSKWSFDTYCESGSAESLSHYYSGFRGGNR